MKRHLVATFGLALAAALGAMSGCASDTGVPAGEEVNAQGEAMSLPSAHLTPEIVAARHFELEGAGLHVTYGASAEVPFLVYRDAVQSLTFRGNDLHVTATEVGTLISVVLRHSVDTGATTFSLLVPRVEVAYNAEEPVVTQAITTFHRFDIGAAPFAGQLQRYGFTPLAGTARAHPVFEVFPGNIPALPAVIKVPPDLVPAIPAFRAPPEALPAIPPAVVHVPGKVLKIPTGIGEAEPGS